VAKDKKNPLVNSTKSLATTQKNDLIKILSERNQELYSLNKEKQDLEQTASKLQNEVKRLRKVKNVYRDKEKQVTNLQTCL
jgi:predicted transcriptional regulator